MIAVNKNVAYNLQLYSTPGYCVVPLNEIKSRAVNLIALPDIALSAMKSRAVSQSRTGSHMKYSP